jgi:methanogenic corrinoid protein MtbC1
MDNTSPIYNIKAVIKETGLSPATLRAWERRYGLIKPDRSPGGHRLYSRQDIELIKWLVDRQNEGLSISRAVEMWKTQPGVFPVESPPIKLPEIVSSTGESMLAELCSRWMQACLAFNDQAANLTLDQAFAIAAPETVCIEILDNGLKQIGQGWYSGSVSVQQEHFASSIAARRLDTLMAALPASGAGKTILVACPPGEEHDFILLLVTYLLRRKGWEVVYLGSNVPLEHLDATINITGPSLAISAAQTLPAAANLSDMARYLNSHNIPLAYGGGIFQLAAPATRSINGYYLGTDLGMLPGIIELLVVAPPEIPEARQVSAEYSQVMESFRKNEPAILAIATSPDRDNLIGQEHLRFASTHLTNLISSALRLGDIRLLDDTVPWLVGWLRNYGYTAVAARQFFRAFRQAVKNYSKLEVDPVIEWLNNM